MVNKFWFKFGSSLKLSFHAGTELLFFLRVLIPIFVSCRPHIHLTSSLGNLVVHTFLSSMSYSWPDPYRVRPGTLHLICSWRSCYSFFWRRDSRSWCIALHFLLGCNLSSFLDSGILSRLNFCNTCRIPSLHKSSQVISSWAS